MLLVVGEQAGEQAGRGFDATRHDGTNGRSIAGRFGASLSGQEAWLRSVPPCVLCSGSCVALFVSRLCELSVCVSKVRSFVLDWPCLSPVGGMQHVLLCLLVSCSAFSVRRSVVAFGLCHGCLCFCNSKNAHSMDR